MFGVFFVAAAFGTAINAVMHTKWGHMINLSYLVGSVWNRLFDLQRGKRAGPSFDRRRARAGENTYRCRKWRQQMLANPPI